MSKNVALIFYLDIIRNIIIINTFLPSRRFLLLIVREYKSQYVVEQGLTVWEKLLLRES